MPVGTDILIRHLLPDKEKYYKINGSDERAYGCERESVNPLISREERAEKCDDSKDAYA